MIYLLIITILLVLYLFRVPLGKLILFEVRGLGEVALIMGSIYVLMEYIL